MNEIVRRHIGSIALVVRDYDEAKAWYCERLGFRVIEDATLPGGKRSVLIAPPWSTETRLLLARAVGPEQIRHIGNQTGGRVFLFLHTEDFWTSFSEMKSRRVRFCEEPRHETYGIVAVFEDLYGNRWDLIQPLGGTDAAGDSTQT
jgi:lactoylglutathione lyase